MVFKKSIFIIQDGRRKKRKAPSRYRAESSDDEVNSSDDEFWDVKKSNRDYFDEREDFFFDSDSNDDLDNELLQNSDEGNLLYSIFIFS